MLTKRQIELVESSWDFVILNTRQAGDIFYDKLFEMDPSLKVLFKNDIKLQAQKLVSMVTFVVHKLETLHEVVKDVEALGKRHSFNYKVMPEHYTTVGSALLSTLQQALGSQWNDEMKAAWAEVFAVLSNTMIKAAEAQSKPSVVR